MNDGDSAKKKQQHAPNGAQFIGEKIFARE
jgi:hypothetical protein